MATEAEGNRSSALTPEQLGMINSAASAAVQSALETAFKSLGPVLQSLALTPEKILELKKPYQDPKDIARQLRESMKSKKDEEEARKALALRREMCPHLDQNGRASIDLVHNFPDHQPRGVCVLCQDWIHPKEWRIGPPTEEYPNGKAYIVPAHKDYKIVMQMESQH